MSQLSTLVADLKAEVAANTTVSGSVLVLVQGLLEQIQTGVDSGSLADIQAAIDSFRANDKSLADVVAANTPSAPNPNPVPNPNPNPNQSPAP